MTLCYASGYDNGALVRIIIINFLLLPAAALAAPLVIDDFSYPDTPAARAAWQEMAGSLPVEMSDSGEWGDERVMKLPCDFSVQTDRSYWDRNIAMDLSGYREFALEIFVPDPGAVSHFTLFFRSGAGWYGNSATVDKPGWQTLYFSVIDFGTEGTPAGWDQIDGIRLSPWKESDQDTYLALRELRTFTPLVFLVKDTQTADTSTVERTTDLLSAWLGRYNVSYGVIDDTDVEVGYLDGSRMAVLPYNNTLSDAALTALESYVAGGGKLMVYYVLANRIAALLGIQETGWTQGDFAAYTFQDDQIQNLPAHVLQTSWNITVAAPTAQYNSRAIAEWQDNQGLPTGYPAWLASDHGLFMSHVIIGDDAANKQYMLLVLIGHYVPEIWPAVSNSAIENIGKIADYLSYDEAVSDIHVRGAQTPRAQSVEAELAQADSLRENAIALLAAAEHAQTVLVAGDARSHLLEAYYLSQSPTWPEFRAVWEHSGTGPYPGDWAFAIDALADNHFTAIFPNMLWGGLAHYDSALLPHSDKFDTYGDQIAACIEAAHQRGIEVHVWKVNWNLSNASQSFIDDMRTAGRTQVTRYGEPADWLCPSHQENFVLERDSMLEVVQNYDVDGIHFDYIRYPSGNNCYCDGCRDRFEQQTGSTVTNWPDDVVDGGPLESAFLDWRREQITNLVSAVYQGVKAIKPNVKVSAAVFSSYAYCKDGVGQDWVDWINRGIVDFLCPMDYTNDFDRFENLVSEQLDYSLDRIPIYPGIGASSSSSSFGPDGVIVQVSTTRRLDTGGFIIFNFDRNLAESVLPALGQGATAAVPDDGGSDAGSDAGSDVGTDAGTDEIQDAGSDPAPGADESKEETSGGCGCSPRAAARNKNNSTNCLLLIFLLSLLLFRVHPRL